MLFWRFIWLQIFFLVQISVYAKKSQAFFESGSLEPAIAIEDKLYNSLFVYAHLIDISYCVSQFRGIEAPFKCDLGCAEAFPNMTLVYQWYSEDSVCGYIAKTDNDVLNNGDQESKRKTIVISLRGTRSFGDTLADINVEMKDYSNLNLHIPPCENCKIHKGFHVYFEDVLSKVKGILDSELETNDYDLVFVGHSMGGSIALLLALHYLDSGFPNLRVVTMGQPLVGNDEFTKWTDSVMGSEYTPSFDSAERKYFRVIHRKDIVTTLPSSDGLLNSYAQFDNQIYLNCSESNSHPRNDQVINCHTGSASNCIEGDFGFFDLLHGQYYVSHTTYFRRLGLCGFRI